MYKMSEFEPASQGDERDDPRVLKSQMRVAALQDGWIQLQGERTASCTSCAAKSGCGIKGLSEIVHRSPLEIQAPTAASAGSPAVGDEVVVSISGHEFLQLAMLAYLLPAAALAAVACLSALAGLGDAQTAILALIAFAMSFLPLRWRERAGNGLTTFAIENPRQTRGAGDTAACSQAEAPEACRQLPHESRLGEAKSAPRSQT